VNSKRISGAVVTLFAAACIAPLSIIAIGGAAETQIDYQTQIRNQPIMAGTLALMPSACSPGQLYFAYDQPDPTWLYGCNASGKYIQLLNLGQSAAFTLTNGTLDINTAVVPRLYSANTFTGLQLFANGLELGAPAGINSTTGQPVYNTQPACSPATRGLVWFQNNGISKDTFEVCAFDGTTFNWEPIF